jgi:Ser/Thr protein kinase RdoA (MazF antagonist)
MTAAFEAVLTRIYERVGVDTLPAHLEHVHGIKPAKVTRLDVGVFRIDQTANAPSLVARLFSAQRPYAAAEADLAVLQALAEVGYRAERPFGEQPLSSHEDQAVLLTEFVHEVPRGKRPPYPIVALGAMVARLHCMPVPAGADRPGGALHHFAEGTMADELRAAAGWLDELVATGPIQAALRDADGGEGLPEAFVHPDPVPKNVIFTADGPVLVDWTAAGRGPRLPSLMLVLKSSWAAAPFLKGYTRRVTLTGEERTRMPDLLFSRQLIDLAFRVGRDPATAASAVRKLPALRRQCEAQATALLAS